MSATKFPSKVDAWLGVVLVGSALVSLAAAGLVLADLGPSMVPLALILVLAGGLLPCWVLVSTHYTLTDHQLIVRCGPFRWKVDLADVHGVEATGSSLSGPALSLERLRIQYGAAKELLVSPRERESFLRELETRRVALPVGN